MMLMMLPYHGKIALNACIKQQHLEDSQDTSKNMSNRVEPASGNSQQCMYPNYIVLTTGIYADPLSPKCVAIAGAAIQS